MEQSFSLKNVPQPDNTTCNKISYALYSGVGVNYSAYIS